MITLVKGRKMESLQAVEYIDIISTSIPSSAQAGSVVNVSITLRALRGPATSPNPLAVMRATALYTRYPYVGTAPVAISLTPSSEIVDLVGDQEVFAGSFIMPGFAVDVTFAVDYKENAADSWSTQEYTDSVVSLGVTPLQIDLSSIVNLMLIMMVMKLMMGFMEPEKATGYLGKAGAWAARGAERVGRAI